jgi:hypothetical protein
VVIIGPHRSWRLTGMVALAFLVAGCPPAVEEPTPTADPTPTDVPSVAASASATPSFDPGGEGEETSAFDLAVGDCFSVESDELTLVTVVACAEPHEYEVFALFDHPAAADAEYPGDAQLLAEADALCEPLFEAYVGHDYQTSIWYITSLTPSDQTWADGDREITCLLNQQDPHEEPIMVSGSAEGASE